MLKVECHVYLFILIEFHPKAHWWYRWTGEDYFNYLIHVNLICEIYCIQIQSHNYFLRTPIWGWGHEVLNISDWSSIRSKYLNNLQLLWHMNMQLQKKAYDRWTSHVQALLSVCWWGRNPAGIMMSVCCFIWCHHWCIVTLKLRCLIFAVDAQATTGWRNMLVA